jgi:hypothetical protein
MANNEPMKPFDFDFSQLEKPKAPAPKPQSEPMRPFNPGKEFKEPPGVAEDTLLGGASGLATGLVGTPGIFGAAGDIADLAFRKIAAYPESWITGKPREEIEQDISRQQQEYAQKRAIPRPPSPSYFIEGAKSLGMPTYKAETVPGQFAQTAGEFVGGSLIGPGSAANRIVSGLGAGLTSEAAGQLYKGSENEDLARFLGSIPGAMAGSAAQSMYAAKRPSAVQERASRIAGDVLREAETDPSAVLDRLKTVQTERAATPGYYVEGVVPTTTQIGGASQALENRILADASRSSSPIVSDIANQKLASREALGAAAAGAPARVGQNIPTVDLKEAFGLTSLNPQGQASTSLKNLLIASEESADKTVKNLWDVPELKNAAIFKNKSVNQLSQYMESLSPSQRVMIDSKVLKAFDDLASTQGTAIPLSFVQDFRSQVLGASREAAKRGDRFGAFVHSDLAEKVANIINDQKNIRFGDVSGASRQAWDKARNATADYYKTFGPSFVKDALAETSAGSAKISGEALLDKMFTNKNASQNFRELKNVLGPEADRHAGDWLVGKLTDNGTNINLTTEKVTKFLSDPKTASLVDEIPGLRQRIENLAQKTGESAEAAKMRQLNTAFEKIVDGNNPQTLSNFLGKYGNELKAIMPEDQRPFIDALERSANVMKTGQASGMAGTKTFDRLANNDIFTILYGRAVGTMTDSAMFGLAAHLAQKLMGTSIPNIEIMGALMGQSGQMRALTNHLRSFANSTIFGTTQDEARMLLQRAMQDPDLRIALMQKPTAANVQIASELVSNILKSSPGYAVQRSLPGAIDYTRENREGRATGGKVGGSIAQRLVDEAAKAHKYHQKTTEEILDAPDEHVVKALAVANKHI